MFTPYTLNLNLAQEPFPNLKYRDRTVLFFIRNGEGKFVLEESSWYPKDICRMLGGGIEKEETVIEGALREMKEETGLDISPERFIELTQITVNGTYQGKTYRTNIFTYFLDLPEYFFQEGYDVHQVVTCTEEAYQQYVQKFLALKDDHLYIKEGQDTFSWGDYGKVYGFVHQKALEEYLKRT